MNIRTKLDVWNEVENHRNKNHSSFADLYNEFSKEKLMSVDDLKKEIERMNKIAPKSKNNQLELSFYVAGMDTAYNNVLSLCNSQEQRETKEADIRCHKGSKTLLPSSDTSVSCEHNTGEDVSQGIVQPLSSSSPVHSLDAFMLGLRAILEGESLRDAEILYKELKEFSPVHCFKPTPVLEGKSAKKFYSEINDGEVSYEQKEFLKECTNLLEESSPVQNLAKYCNCGKYLGFRGFCSEECHNKYYDNLTKENSPVQNPKECICSEEHRLFHKHRGRDICVRCGGKL